MPSTTRARSLATPAATAPRARTPRKARARNNTISAKMGVVHRAASGEGLGALAKDADVTVQTVRRWCRAGDNLAQVKDPEKRLSRSSPAVSELDKSLLQWVREERRHGREINGILIRAQAMEIDAQLGGRASFTASGGWLLRFLRRHGLSAAGEPLSSHGEEGKVCDEVDRSNGESDGVHDDGEKGLGEEDGVHDGETRSRGRGQVGPIDPEKPAAAKDLSEDDGEDSKFLRQPHLVAALERFMKSTKLDNAPFHEVVASLKQGSTPSSLGHATVSPFRRASIA